MPSDRLPSLQNGDAIGHPPCDLHQLRRQHLTWAAPSRVEVHHHGLALLDLSEPLETIFVNI